MADARNGADVSNWDALAKAFVMIVVSEIGDKTFLIAAIMASRHPRVTVFAGAFASLVVMSILSAALGRVILGLVPKVWTLWAAAVLFIVFGIKMLHEASSMSASHLSEEMREVEEELEHDSATHDPSNPRGQAVPLEDLEEGHGLSHAHGRGIGRSSPTLGGASLSAPLPRSPSRAGAGVPKGGSSRSRSPSPSPGRRPLTGGSGGGGAGSGGRRSGPGLSLAKWRDDPRESMRNVIQLLTSPVFAQAFVLTFLGEWGDRSQITTIAMGGAHSIPVIAFGTILGHGVCTFGAVMGGRYLSTKISVKHISLIGAVAFLVFGLLYAVEAWSTPWDAQAGDDFEW